MSIFGDSEILDNDLLNENLRESQSNGENNQQAEDDDGNDNDENENKDDEEPKPLKLEPKRRVRRLAPSNINPDMLMGQRGMQTVENHFKDIKFKGKGHERDDLNDIMKRLEHWSHRLFPKYNFDDNLAAIEAQGKKKIVQVHMTKYRRNMLVEQQIASDEEEEHEGVSALPNEPFDEMDELLEQQISKHDRTHNTSIVSTTSRNHDFDSILASPLPSTPQSSINDDRQVQSTQKQLSVEQQAAIAESRRRAEELKRKRQQERQEMSVVIEE